MERIIDYFNEEAKTHDYHVLNQMGTTEFYDEIEKQFDRCANKQKILILGCGTGLEVERIKFKSDVVAVDISPEMLAELHKKTFYGGMNLKTICASILDFNFGNDCFNIVLTCYTLHHFSVEQKRKIFRKIHSCLLPDGVFINGDIMSKSTEEESQRFCFAESNYSSANLPFGSLHIDVPLTYQRELSLVKEADFHQITIEKEWTNTKLYRCIK